LFSWGFSMAIVLFLVLQGVLLLVALLHLAKQVNR
jgi:hypothetical protein